MPSPGTTLCDNQVNSFGAVELTAKGDSLVVADKGADEDDEGEALKSAFSLLYPYTSPKYSPTRGEAK